MDQKPQDTNKYVEEAGNEGARSPFCCPVCKARLLGDGKRLFCPEGHSFDLAKEGYVNLLPGKKGAHGDDRTMTEARRRFLEKGHYLPLRLTVTRRLLESAPDAVLDAGCGEGWYTAGIAAALPDARILAVDVSRDAVRAAAKRKLPRVSCAVASVTALPVDDGSVNAVVSVFSPLCEKEFSRVLAPGGTLVYACPGEKHLWQLKELLYDDPYENEPRSKRIPGFEFVKEDELHYTRALDAEELKDLFTMTPYFYRTPQTGRSRLGACAGLDVEMAFRVLVYRKKESESAKNVV